MLSVPVRQNAAEQKKGGKMSEETENAKEKKEVVFGQLRVPNIKKGYNPNYPFYMMGIFVVLIVLSALFALATD